LGNGKYVVAKFEGHFDNEGRPQVDIISSKWLTSKDDPSECFWPSNNPKAKEVEALVKARTAPEKDRTKYKIECIARSG